MALAEPARHTREMPRNAPANGGVIRGDRAYGELPRAAPQPAVRSFEFSHARLGTLTFGAPFGSPS